MDEGADMTKVEWREWSQESLDEAADRGKPVLLAMVVPWSPECRKMDQITYGEPRIAANINDVVVPIRVDADRNPRVRERYNVGGFPSTVFLTPAGEILAGATLLDVDGFRELLTQVRETWERDGEKAGSVPQHVQGSSPPAGPVDARIEEQMVEQLLGTYDTEFAGWGDAVKFPMPRTIEFALVRAPDQALATLDAIEEHLFDADEGGFYRFAHNRNWQDTRHEKLTDENAALIRAFSYGYRYTGDEKYRETATKTVEYLVETLWTGDAFAASQGGDTIDETSGPVDETIFADRNAAAVDALLRYWMYTESELARRHAEQAREYLLSELVTDGEVTHYRDEMEVGESGLLLDQASVLTALTTSWEVLGESGPVRAVADWTIENLQTANGTFRDGPIEGPGLVGEPLYPLDTAAECAASLLDLALLSGDQHYREVAANAISSFAGATDRMGVQVAQYASVASRLLSPQAIEVGTAAGTDLHRAALRLADHETVVVPAADAPRSGLTGDPVPDRTARLVTDGEEDGYAESPHELETLLTGPS